MDAQGLYRQQSIETASPARLVSMLYHGGIEAIVRAEAHLSTGNAGGANHELQRAQAIVTELKMTLDFANGGAIARNLDALYAFCIEQLIAGNVRKDAGPLAAARETLSGLASAWDEMVASQATPQGSYTAVGAVG